jgi:Protein of unknown function DUF262
MAEVASNLIGAIENKLSRVSTQALDISFNELLDMATNGELNISPDYQRLFRWSEGQRSRFIESLILQMPIPPIFVIEEDEGKYLLIDGLQRISSYLHFRGQLDAPHLDPPVKGGEALSLVEELNGKKFEDLPPSLQIRLKRAFIRVEIVRKGTDPHFKYHMFKRLNTGGEDLSDQQVRNCAIRLLSSDFPEFLIKLSKTDSFVSCTVSLTQNRMLEAEDQELVLRFFALKNRRDRFKHGVNDFLTEFMEDVADPDKPYSFKYDDEEKIFLKTFAILGASLGEKAFAFRNKAGNELASGFSIYHFESITMGIQPILELLDPDDMQQMKKLKEELRKIKLDAEFAKMTTGGGKNSPGLLKDRIEKVEKHLANAFN